MWEERGHTNTQLYNLKILLKANVFSEQMIPSSCVMPRIGLLPKDSESLLRMNKTQEASSLDLERDPVFLFKYNLPLAIFSPIQEARNGFRYMNVGRELPKEESSGQVYGCSGWYRVQVGTKQEQSSIFLRRCGLSPNLGRLASGGRSALEQRTFFSFFLYFGKSTSNVFSRPKSELNLILTN